MRVITISMVVLTCLDNFTVFGQQTRGTKYVIFFGEVGKYFLVQIGCGTKFDPSKVEDFVVSSSSEIKIHEVTMYLLTYA